MLLGPRIVGVMVGSLCLAACSFDSSLSTAKIDPSGHLGRRDYLDLRERTAETVPQDDQGFPPIPETSTELIPPPPPPPVGSTRLVSVTVTDSVPLRDVLIELARESKVNLELDPRIQGGIIFTAHNQPFNDVLKRICSMAGLRSTVEGNFIRIELDERWTPATEHAGLHVLEVRADDVRLSITPASGLPMREVTLKPYQTYQLSTGTVVEGSLDSAPILSR